MQFARAAKFGLLGTVGFAVVSFVTGFLVREIRTGLMAAGEATALTAVIGLAGAAVTLVFLFTLVGEYVDRELAARGLDDPDG